MVIEQGKLSEILSRNKAEIEDDEQVLISN